MLRRASASFRRRWPSGNMGQTSLLTEWGLTAMSYHRHSIRNSWSLEQLELRLLFTVENAFGAQQDPNLSTESTANAAEFSDVPDIGTSDNWNVNAVRAPEA